MRPGVENVVVWVLIAAFLTAQPTRAQTTACGGELTEQSGLITSPGYPDNYPNNQRCEWTVRASKNEIVTLRFSRLDLEGTSSDIQWVGDTCPDYVRVYDGDSDLSPLLATMCRIKTSAELAKILIRSTSNVLFIVFRSDYVGQRPGFVASYLAQECPEFHYGTEVCNISCPCDIEKTASCNNTNGNCVCKKGWTSSDCSQDINECLNTTVDFCRFDYKECVNKIGSFDCVCRAGLAENSLGECEVKPDSVCDPGNSCSHLCIKISGQEQCYCPENMKLVGNTCQACSNVKFGTDCQNSCPCNEEGTESCDIERGGCLCLKGWTSPDCSQDINECTELLESVCTSSGEKCENTYGGYECICKSGLPRQPDGTCGACSYILTNSSGGIKTPGYPNYLNDNMICNWTINAEGSGMTISFNISDMYASYYYYSDENCYYSHLRVYDGSNSSGPIIGDYCGRYSNTGIIRSSGSTMFIELIVNRYGGSSRVNAAYSTAVYEVVRSVTSEQSGVIASPGFPVSPAFNVSYSWTLTVSYDKRVNFSFSDIYLGECGKDFVDIYDGKGPGYSRIAHFCGNNHFSNVVSTRNTMHIIYSSLGSTNEKGFNGSFIADACRCYSGYTESCNSPEGPCVCKVGITGSHCDSDIDECQTNSCPAHSTCINYFGTFECICWNGTKVNADGFCDDWNKKLNGPSGEIHSQEFPNPYPRSVNYTWSLHGKTKEVVTFRFSQFDVLAFDKCYADFVEIYDGEIFTSKLIGQYCGKSVPGLLRSTTPELSIYFRSNYYYYGYGPHAGFKGTYYTHECQEFMYGEEECTSRCSCKYENTRICDNTNGVCFCKPGWVGSGCSQDLDECRNPRFCPENSKCFNEIGSYTCDCDSGYVMNPTGQCEESTRCSDEMKQKCSQLCDVDQSTQIEKCYCSEDFDLLDDDATCVVSLYPHSFPARDESAFISRDGRRLPRDDFIVFNSLIPFGTNFLKTAKVMYNGVIMFNGLTLMSYPDLANAKANNYYLLAPFWTENGKIGTGDVFYHVYETCSASLFMDPGERVRQSPEKDEVVARAIRDLKKFYNLPDFEVSVAFVVTWINVQTKDCSGGNTFQAVLVSGHTPATEEQSYLQVEEKSYAIFMYKEGSGTCQPGQPFQVGSVAADSGVTTVSFDNDDPQMAQTLGNTGYRGVHTFPVGTNHNEMLMCQRYLCKHADLIGNQHFQDEINELYQCPCSLDKLGLQWKFLKDEGDTKCYSIREVAKRRLLRTNQRNRICCYTWTPPRSDSWEDWHESWLAGSFIPNGHLLVTDPWPESRNPGSSNPYQDAQKNMQARTWCCEQSYQFCGNFYKIFGDLQCTTHPVFVPASALGDPEIVTLDGKKYFMNGWAEYIMLKVTNFTLQCRTEIIENNGIVSNGTVFTGFAAQEGNSANVQVLLDTTGTSMEFLANGNDLTNDFYEDSAFTFSTETVSVQRIDEGKRIIAAVSFACGVSFRIRLGVRSLQIDIEMDNSLRNMSMGLLGNNNGDPNDDFLLPNGTILSPNSTERQIFEQFASEYQVTPLTSVFTYNKGESSADYQHTDFTPLFFDEIPSDVLSAARKVCGENDDACVYDFTVTGSENFAKNTKEAKEVHEETKRRFNNNPPSVTFVTNSDGENHWLVHEGQINIASVEVKDEDNDEVTIELLGNISGVVLKQSGVITYTPDLVNPISLNIRAKDSVGSYSSILTIQISVCPTCNSHGVCDSNATSAEFYAGQYKILKCDCFPAYTGGACELELDACKSLPCAQGQVCTDLTAAEQGNSSVGHTCGPCPAGTTNVDGLCEDIDECTNSTLCDQVCINTYRSYKCDCRPGFRIDQKNNRICVDIDECEEKTSGCEQVCSNAPGNYTCACKDGYTLRSDGVSCEIDANNAAICQPCQQVCYVTSTQQVSCDCNLGFQIDSNNPTECIDIDECNSGGNSPCSQICTNTWGSFMCSCDSGYVQGTDGISCNECDSFHFGENCSSICNCRGRGRCDRVQGCICNEHWTGANCDKDVNECRNPQACPEGMVCLNEPGSFSCKCPKGYRLDNGICSDIDECKEIIHNCDLSLEDCYNIEGNYSCLCKKGFRLNDQTGVCEDINECEQHSDGCEHLCENAIGYFRCSCNPGFKLASNRRNCDIYKQVCNLTCSHGCSVGDNGTAFCICPRGYKLLGADSCEDINECESLDTNPCNHQGTCINTDGNYICTCDAGFRLDNDGRSCVACSPGTWGVGCNNSCACGKEAISCDPVTGCQCKPGCSGEHCTEVTDRCASGELTCQLNEECVVSGCSSVCQCAKGFIYENEQCQDENECLNQKNNCDQICTNTPGSFVCSCNAGYTYNTTTKTCVDVDECQNSSLHNCEHVCTNTKGSFVCSCRPGYSFDALNNSCTDVDECQSSKLPKCEQICTNTEGSFVCSCNSGHSYNASTNTCIDVDECQNPALGNCDQVCTNTKGSFVCSCHPGYSYDSSNNTCHDVDECQNPALGNCDQVCTNTNGSFVCSCHPGYSYDASANKCNDVNECEQNPCGEICVNTNGSYYCSCPTGQFLLADGKTCDCPNGCDVGCKCVENNTDHCNKRSGECFCKKGWTSENCSVDIDECKHNICPDNRKCRNLNGSFECSCWNELEKGSDGTCIDCDRTLTEKKGYLMSSHYPDLYQDNSYCTWTIKVKDPQAVIELSFIDYDVDCPFDYVRIYYGSNQRARSFVQVCENWRTPFISKGNSLHLVFTSGPYFSRKGFHAFYTSYLPCQTKKCSHTCRRISSNPVNEKCQCPDWMILSQSDDSKCIYTNAFNTTITEPAGSIVSPNYPNEYPADSTWRWTIQGSKDSFVKLRFFDFSLENSFQCVYDVLTIYDGNSKTAPQLGRFCGSNLPPVIISSGNTILIVLNTDSTLNYAGFKVGYNIYEK